MLRTFNPRPCAKCKRPFTPRGPRAQYCDACPRAKTAGAKKPKAARSGTGGGTAKKSTPKTPAKPAPAKKNGPPSKPEPTVRHAYASVIADLDEQIAQRELTIVALRQAREALAGL